MLNKFLNLKTCFLILALIFSLPLYAENKNSPQKNKEIRFAPIHVDQLVSAESHQLLAKINFLLESLKQAENSQQQLDLWRELQTIARDDQVFDKHEFLEYPIGSGVLKSLRRVIFEILLEFKSLTQNPMIDKQSETYLKELDESLLNYSDSDYEKILQDAWPYVAGRDGIKILKKIAEFFYESATIEEPYLPAHLFLAEEAVDYGLLLYKNNPAEAKALRSFLDKIQQTLYDTVEGLAKPRLALNLRELAPLKDVFRDVLKSDAVLSNPDLDALSFYELAFDLGYSELAKESIKSVISERDMYRSKKAISFSGKITETAFDREFLREIAQYLMDYGPPYPDGRDSEISVALTSLARKDPDFMIPKLARMNGALSARILVSLHSGHPQKITTEIENLLASSDVALRTQALIILSIAGLRMREFAPKVLAIIQDSSLKDLPDRVQAIRAISNVESDINNYLPALLKILKEEPNLYPFKQVVAHTILDRSSLPADRLQALPSILGTITSFRDWYTGTKEEDLYLNELISIVKKFSYVFDKTKVGPAFLEILEHIQVNNIESVCQYPITGTLSIMNVDDAEARIMDIYKKSSKYKYILLNNLKEFPIGPKVKNFFIKVLDTETDARALKTAIGICGNYYIAEALPSLNRLLKSADIFVRDEARSSIFQIENHIRLQKKAGFVPLPE